MAPLPADSTARVKIAYNTCQFDHEVMIRFKEPDTVDDVIADFNSFITAIESLLFLSTFIGAQVAVSGSNVFNDVPGSWPVTWGSDAGAKVSTAWYYDFIGRSLDGRRVRMALFGAKQISTTDDYRAFSAEVPAIEDGVAILNAAEGTFLSINGFQPVWKPYANSGVNAYWRNKIR
jgi:hypothetical protein